MIQMIIIYFVQAYFFNKVLSKWCDLINNGFNQKKLAELLRESFYDIIII